MPRSISLNTLIDQTKAAEKAMADAKKAVAAAKEAQKTEEIRQERALALRIGYLAIKMGLGGLSDGELESLFKKVLQS